MVFSGLTKIKNQDLEKEETDQCPVRIAPSAEPRRRILVVDDDTVISDFLSEIFLRMGYDVVTASNGDDAWIQFTNKAFGLVLTDLEMPGINGFTLAKRIKEQSPRTPVIMVTGQSPEEVMKKTVEGVIDSVILKPFKLEEIRRKVNEFLDGPTFKSP